MFEVSREELELVCGMFEDWGDWYWNSIGELVKEEEDKEFIEMERKFYYDVERMVKRFIDLLEDN